MAAESSIKHTQLTRVGYTYQDLVCIQMLINWFHDPDMYQWVCIEGSKELGVLKSLDDVVCFTANGAYELYQVKFTTDSERDDLRLDFDWLMKKKERGTSLIEKWSADIERFGTDEEISVAKLITNRRPDDVLGSCISDGKICYDHIPSDVRVAILDQVEEGKARLFFDTLIFEHSQPEVDDLENLLQDSLVPDHSSIEGWLQFKKAVERWATRKNEPAPDGKIKLDHIREVLSLGTRRTISQFFEVPGGYVPPVEEFHNEVLGKTTSPGSWVISGSPGMGKSTYLSYLTDCLNEHDQPVIRHHYSLSAQSIGDRIAYTNAARSLQSQLKNLYPDNFDSDRIDPEQLESWVETAASLASSAGKQLVIVVDGLDHVYRERPDISQLVHLVNRLDKFKDRVCLIYGTQPVSDECLPSALLRSSPRETAWIDIPPMGLEPIKAWVDHLISIGSLNVVGDGEHQRNEIIEVSRALREVSGGYPLHVIYSVNRLVISASSISKYDVERLPKCTEGDIHSYYETLWVSLSEGAKEILMLIANAEFSWPDENHLGCCFDEELAFRNSFGEIQHLIENRLSGISPFHGSLLVFLRNKSSFKQAVRRLNEKSKEWIKAQAPEYWKWGWEWIIEANLGDYDPLLTGITRDWLIKSLCSGYPLEHIEHIFVYAENIAYENKLYSELLRIRTLKTRLLNGPEFQIQKFEDFVDCAFKCSTDNFGLLWRADNLRIIDDEELVVVAKHFQGKDERIVSSCEEEIYRRIRFYARLGDSDHYNVLGGLIDGYLEVLTCYDRPDLSKISEFYQRLNDKKSSLVRIIELLISNGHRYLVLDIFSLEVPDEIVPAVVDEVVLAASAEGVPPEEIIDSDQLKESRIGQVRRYIDSGEIEVGNLVEPQLPKETEYSVDHVFSEYFWYHVAQFLQDGRSCEKPVYTSADSLESYISQTGLFFKYAGSVVAACLRDGKAPGLFELYSFLDTLEYPDNYSLGYPASVMRFTIKKAITSIVIQLGIVSESIDQVANLDVTEYSKFSSSKWWDFRVFCDLLVKSSIPGFPSSFTAEEFSELYDQELASRDNTSTLANDSLEIALLSANVGGLDDAYKFLHRSATNMVGYGWRKDITFHEVFEAIDECSKAGCEEVSEWLQRVVTFTSDVFDFSEREIRHIPGWFTQLLARHLPERLVDEYDYHLSEENWYRTDLILENIVSTFPLSESIEHSFLRCTTTYGAMIEFEKRAEDDAVLGNLFEEQCRTLGGLPPKPRESSSSSEDELGEIPDVSDYAPDDVEKIIGVLNEISYRQTEDFMGSWIAYWDSEGEGKTVLTSFDQHYQSGKSNMDLDRCLPAFYTLSKKLEGKIQAYKWAVRDVILNSCWGRLSPAHAEKSLAEYASTYKSKWEEFLTDTTKPGTSRYGNNETVIVPSSSFVAYLIAAEQIELAVQITEVMVKSLEDDISHLPLSKPYWYEEPVASEQIMSHLLLLHYKWPDRYSRLLTAKQIAENLSNDENGFRVLYLEFLADQAYEAEIVDLLSILYLTESQPFSKEELLESIRFPSVLTDQVIENLWLSEDERSDWSNLYSEFPDEATPDTEKYNRYANGMAQRFVIVQEDLGKEIGVDLNRHMVLEWEGIQERKQSAIFDPYDFCGDQFYRQDRIGCAFSWSAESSILSAYLRTLAFAHDQHGLSKDKIQFHAQEVLPFGEVISSVSPSSKPVNWPVLEKIEEGDELPNERWLASKIETFTEDDEIVIRANGPVLRDHRGVCCDLKVIVVSLHDSELTNPKEMFESIGWARNKEVGVFPIASESYPAAFGRWGVDWLMRGYYRPSYSIGDLPVNSISHQENCVEYFGGTVSNGVWRYWVDEWYPAHHAGVGSSIGTYFTTSKSIMEALESKSKGERYMIAELAIIDHRGYGSEKEPAKIYAMKKL